jgi:hypothetical protein
MGSAQSRWRSEAEALAWVAASGGQVFAWAAAAGYVPQARSALSERRKAAAPQNGVALAAERPA